MIEAVDLREELKSRIVRVQQEVEDLKAEKDKIDKKLQDADAKLNTWRRAYEIEAERVGETGLPLFVKSGKSYRFAGMRLIDALAMLRKEQPAINKEQAREILETGGFDFRGKRPLPAVHFAWVALNRKKK